MNNEKYKGRILIAEDEGAIRSLLEEKLTGDGYHVDLVSDGEQALETVADGDYDLLISDIRMPNMSGPEWLSKVPGIEKDYLILLLSGEYEPTELDSLHQVQGIRYEFLKKPFNIKYLNQLVNEMFENSGRAK